MSLQRVEVDDGLSRDERALLRKKHAEKTDAELTDLYKSLLEDRFRAPEEVSKKDRICVLLQIFGEKVNSLAMSEAVNTTQNYIKHFGACDDVDESTYGVTQYYREELYNRGDAAVVLQRKMYRTNSLSTQVRNAVLDRDENKCRRCGSTETLEIHHIIPYSRGGKDEVQNLATLCHDCHRAATLTRSSSGEVPAYPPGEFEAWLEDDLDICGAKTTKKTLCQNPPGSCPHHE